MITAVECREVTVVYGRRTALWNVSCTLPAGVLAAIVGPNGAGKSTLVRAILGLIPLQRGQVRLWGQEPSVVRARVSYMPQRESVEWDFPLTVLDVVLMGRYGHLRLFQRPRSQDYERAWEALVRVGMQHLAQRPLGELSGGQQQRVFLARALAQDAELYVMDEPFAGIDAATEQVLLQVLRQLKESGKTVIVVHHDLHAVARLFEWVVLLNQRLVAAGPVEEVLTGPNLQMAYGGRSALLEEVLQRAVLPQSVASQRER